MKVRLSKFKRIIIGSIVLFSIIIGLIFYVLAPFPQSMVGSSEYPASFYITKPNRFELQPPNQCAAYATAFVLRNFGKEANGEDLYKKMPFKIPVSGYVLPKGVITSIRTHGLKPEIYQGDMLSLKGKIAEGNPVIVLIGRGLQWQHYMTLVGYDDEKKELYFYDSKRDSDDNESIPGNRTMTEEYFMELWENGLPIFNRVYITVSE